MQSIDPKLRYGRCLLCPAFANSPAFPPIRPLLALFSCWLNLLGPVC